MVKLGGFKKWYVCPKCRHQTGLAPIFCIRSWHDLWQWNSAEKSEGVSNWNPLGHIGGKAVCPRTLHGRGVLLHGAAEHNGPPPWANLQKCGVTFFSIFLCQRCREIWHEMLVKFSACLDDQQVAHLICVHLKHLQDDFLRGCLSLLNKKNNRREAQSTSQKVKKQVFQADAD